MPVIQVMATNQIYFLLLFLPCFRTFNSCELPGSHLKEVQESQVKLFLRLLLHAENSQDLHSHEKEID